MMRLLRLGCLLIPLALTGVARAEGETAAAARAASNTGPYNAPTGPAVRWGLMDTHPRPSPTAAPSRRRALNAIAPPPVWWRSMRCNVAALVTVARHFSNTAVAAPQIAPAMSPAPRLRAAWRGSLADA